MPTTPLPDYQHIFRSLPENFLLLGPDADATILDDTDSHQAVALKRRAEVVGKPFFEAYPTENDESRQAIITSHEHVRRFLEPHAMPLIRYDLERPAEQGGGFDEFYWQATHYPILDAQGQLQYILQRSQNVTEQLRAAKLATETQQKLTNEQDRTRFILNSLPVLIWTATPDGQRDYFNPRWLAFTGKAMADEVGEQWMESLHPGDRARVRAHWQHCVATGEPYQLEYRLRRADGQYRWILVRATPHHDAQGQITLWVGGATDIHDQRQLVQELLETNEQQAALSEQAYRNYHLAQQQRQTLYNVLMKAPAFVSIVRGPEHRYEFANEQYLTLARSVELVGRTVAEVFPEIESQGLLAIIDRVYETGESYIGHEMLIQLDPGDGSGRLREAYFNFSYQRFDEGGQPAGITSYAYEVTELVAVRRALAARRAE